MSHRMQKYGMGRENTACVSQTVRQVTRSALHSYPERADPQASPLQPAAAIACAKGIRCTVLGLTPNLVAALRTDRPSLRASRIRERVSY